MSYEEVTLRPNDSVNRTANKLVLLAPSTSLRLVTLNVRFQSHQSEHIYA